MFGKIEDDFFVINIGTENEARFKIEKVKNKLKLAKLNNLILEANIRLLSKDCTLLKCAISLENINKIRYLATSNMHYHNLPKCQE